MLKEVDRRLESQVLDLVTRFRDWFCVRNQDEGLCQKSGSSIERCVKRPEAQDLTIDHLAWWGT